LVDHATSSSASPSIASNSERTVLWVAPAYNEEASIEDLIDRIAEVSSASGWNYRIIIVDDGSRDATGDLSRAKGLTLPVTVVRNEPNQGLGRTIRRGLALAAEESGSDDVVMTLDADLTQDPGYAPSMLEKLDEGFDVVIASRYRPGSAVEGLSQFRTLLSYGASAIVALVRPVRGVRDYSCGFRAYRANTLREAFARDGDDFVSERGFGCMVEIAERLRGHADFAEVPFVLRYDAKRKESAIKILPTIGAYFRVIAKVATSLRDNVSVAPFVLAFASVALGAMGRLLLRPGVISAAAAPFPNTLPSVAVNPTMVAGLGLYALAAVLWLVVLSRLDLTVAYPLGAFGYVIFVLLAGAYGEHISPLKWGGVIFIVLGVLLVGWLGASPRKPVRA
jgi:dolichol-phosphate mannosyltransferase